MMFEETFRQAVDDIRNTNLKILDNGNDLHVYPVPESVIAKVRDPFKLHLDEEVLYVRDTGFWNDGSQGTVVTDWGVTVIPDNEEPDSILQIKWVDVEYVEYSAKCLYFFYSSNNRNNNSAIHICHLLKYYDDEDTCRINGEVLANIFTNMACSQSGDNAEKAIERMKEYHEEGNWENSVEEADNVLSMANDEDHIRVAKIYKASALKQIAISYNWDDDTPDDEKEIQMKNREQYLRASDEVYQELEDVLGPTPWIYNERAFLRCGGTNFSNKDLARRYYIAGMQGDADDKKEAIKGYKWTTDYLFSWFEDFERNSLEILNDPSLSEEEKEEFIMFAKENLFSNRVPFGDRQFILFAKNVNQIAGFFDKEDNIKWVFTLDRIPSDLVIEGAPSANVLYMAHPIKTNYYLPYENAEETIFMEKVREFCYMVQCLGATEVSFKSLKGLNISETNARNLNADAQLDIFYGTTKVNVNNSSRSSANRNNNQEIGMRQHFNPTKKPYCPDDLVWLDSDATWRMIVKQRLEGNMLNYHYRIKSSETCNLTNNQILDVKASFESIMLDVNANFKVETDTTFSKHEETEWEITVTFKPIQEFGKDMNSSSDSPMLNSAETEYLNELKEILADGEISPRERRLLDKIRVSLGITENRAKELEESLSPKLTPEEQEYLDEYREIIAGGEISPRDQRFLEKLKKANGISDKRALEIEKLV